MSEIKKKKIYLLRDQNESDINATLKDNGVLTIEMTFKDKFLDERQLYATFAELGWMLKYEEFQPDLEKVSEPVFIPPTATFH